MEYLRSTGKSPKRNEKTDLNLIEMIKYAIQLRKFRADIRRDEETNTWRAK